MQFWESLHFILGNKVRLKVRLAIAKRSCSTILIPRIDWLCIRNPNALLIKKTAISSSLCIGFAFRDSSQEGGATRIDRRFHYFAENLWLHRPSLRLLLHVRRGCQSRARSVAASGKHLPSSKVRSRAAWPFSLWSRENEVNVRIPQLFTVHRPRRSINKRFIYYSVAIFQLLALSDLRVNLESDFRVGTLCDTWRILPQSGIKILSTVHRWGQVGLHFVDSVHLVHSPILWPIQQLLLTTLLTMALIVDEIFAYGLKIVDPTCLFWGECRRLIFIFFAQGPCSRASTHSIRYGRTEHGRVVRILLNSYSLIKMDARRSTEGHLDLGGRKDVIFVGLLGGNRLRIRLLILPLKINVPRHVKLVCLSKC